MTCSGIRFLPTPSARRATVVENECILAPVLISTHALREEGDSSSDRCFAIKLISTHALREEGDENYSVVKVPTEHFYPRPPRGGRRVLLAHQLVHVLISTHALREEGDAADQGLFQPRKISTHALREEGDLIV